MVQLEVYTQLQRTWFMEWSIMDDVLVTACHLNCCCVDTVATWLDECYIPPEMMSKYIPWVWDKIWMPLLNIIHNCMEELGLLQIWSPTSKPKKGQVVEWLYSKKSAVIDDAVCML